MIQNHLELIEKIKNELEEEIPMTFKPSSQLLNLKKVEQQLANQ